jgi:choice-of-anchor A domain-containing protein
MNKLSISLGLILLLSSPLQLAAALNPWSFNVYTIDNIGSSSQGYGSDFQGIAGSGGSSYLSNFSLNGDNTVPSSIYSLYSEGNVVFNSGSVSNGGIQTGGNANLSSITVSGTVYAAGSLTGSGGSISGNVVLGETNQSSLSINGTVSQNQPFTSTVNYNTFNSFFTNASQFWGNQAQNVTWSVSFGQMSVGNLAAGRNVINLTAAQFNSVTSLSVSGPSTAFLIINIDGNNLTTLNSLTFNLSGGLTLNNVLVNLPQATSVTLNGGTFGSLLAPLATVTFPNGLLTGNLIAENLLGSGQVDQGTFTGFSQDQGLTVPEPSSYMVMGSFLLMTMSLWFKKNNQFKKA